jgi:hypothetical protein
MNNEEGKAIIEGETYPPNKETINWSLKRITLVIQGQSKWHCKFHQLNSQDIPSVCKLEPNR